MVLAMFTSGSWPYFFPIPIWPLRRTRLLCWNCGRRWETVVLDSWKMLRAYACMWSILLAVLGILRYHISWPKKSLVIWPCRTVVAMMVSCNITTQISRGSQMFSTVCFTFGHAAEATCEHAGRTNWFDLISPYFTNFQFHHGFCFNFTISQIFSKSGQRNHCIRAWKENSRKGKACGNALNAYSSCRMKCSKQISVEKKSM